MAEITKDGRYVIQVPYRGYLKIQSFSGLRGVSEYVAAKRAKLGDHHPFMVALTDEFGRFLPIMRDRGILPADDVVIPLSMPRSGSGKLQRHIVPNVLFAHQGQVTSIMTPAVAAWFERNYYDKYLEDDPRLAAKRHVSRYLTDDNYRVCVDEETAAAEAFNAAATLVAEPTIWGPHLPARPPRLWIERDPQTETDPAVFLGTVYQEWLPWLSRRDIRYIDRTLYFVYAQWLGSDDPKWLDANGKKSPPVEFGGNPRGRMDDAVYGANAREKSRLATAKSREAKLRSCDKSAQFPPPVR